MIDNINYTKNKINEIFRLLELVITEGFKHNVTALSSNSQQLLILEKNHIVQEIISILNQQSTTMSDRYIRNIQCSILQSILHTEINNALKHNSYILQIYEYENDLFLTILLIIAHNTHCLFKHDIIKCLKIKNINLVKEYCTSLLQY